VADRRRRVAIGGGGGEPPFLLSDLGEEMGTEKIGALSSASCLVATCNCNEAFLLKKENVDFY
jgi:hypothetical protein